MLLQLADYYPLIFLAPFLVLALVWGARRYATPRHWRLRALAAPHLGQQRRMTSCLIS